MPTGEIQTREAIKRIVDDGKVLFIPRVGLDFEKCDMDLVRAVIPLTSDVKADRHDEHMFYDDWPRNKWGIPEPPLNEGKAENEVQFTTSSSLIAQPGDIDLLIVPGLAFDSNNNRLGQGKGYYDRFISKMRNEGEKKPLLVGVCLEEQFIDLGDDGTGGIPVSDHDYIMDMVFTPTKMI